MPLDWVQYSDHALTDNFEEILTALRDAAEMKATEASHPTVAFYCGERAARLTAATKDRECSDTDDGALYVISLHQALLPPLYGDSFSEEDHALRLSSTEGLELLQSNWELLLWLLMPSVQLSASFSATESVDDSSPISSWHELCRPLTWNDYTKLRQPGIMDRVHYSYVVFLRFYGWRLHNEENGVIDRHRGWRARYSLLSSSSFCCCRRPIVSGVDCKKSLRCCSVDDGVPCPYNALTRIIRVLLELCFNRYAVNLVAFLIEEMSKGRLLFLKSRLEKSWFPIVTNSKQVTNEDRDYLRRKLYNFMHSDSD